VKNRIAHILVLLVLLAIAGALLIAGCVGKTDFPTNLPESTAQGPSDTTYLVVHPVWTAAGGIEFNQPRGVSFGYDGTVYICDTENNRIVRMSIAGEFIEEYAVEHPEQVTQDRQLNLMCVDGEGTVYRRNHFTGGEFDTVVYRDSMRVLVEIQRRVLDSALVDSEWVKFETLVYDTITVATATGFTGIAASPLSDRYYYLVDSTRDMITVQDVEDRGLAPDMFRAFNRAPAYRPMGIMTYPVSETLYHLVFTQWGGGAFDDIRIVRSDNFADVRLDTNDIYWLPPNGPKMVTRDDGGNFLITSALANKVYRFSRHGAFFLEFGGSGTEPGQLNTPRGIAYGEKTIYIADTGNNRIVRYRLSTDLQF